MNVAVDLAEDVAALAKNSGQSVEQGVSMAVVFDVYLRGLVSAGKAADLLGLDRLAFEELRISRGVDRPDVAVTAS